MHPTPPCARATRGVAEWAVTVTDSFRPGVGPAQRGARWPPAGRLCPSRPRFRAGRCRLGRDDVQRA